MQDLYDRQLAEKARKAQAYRTTSYSEGHALDGSRTIIKSTESSMGGYWEQRSACLKCAGREEVTR